jgi:hypothetical protein
MTYDEAVEAAGSALAPSDEALAWCSLVVYRTAAGDATAYVHNPERLVIAIQTPEGTRTDRRVGAGSTLDDLTDAYGADHTVRTVDTQAGNAAYVTTGDPDANGMGEVGLIGFEWDGVTLGPPMVGGIPGYEYCSG